MDAFAPRILKQPGDLIRTLNIDSARRLTPSLEYSDQPTRLVLRCRPANEFPRLVSDSYKATSLQFREHAEEYSPYSAIDLGRKPSMDRYRRPAPRRRCCKIRSTCQRPCRYSHSTKRSRQMERNRGLNNFGGMHGNRVCIDIVDTYPA
jgi:hypothetical protein